MSMQRIDDRDPIERALAHWKSIALAVVVIVMFFYAKNIYVALVRHDEMVERHATQVMNVYQKRSDLIENLVNTVKGSAGFEKDTLESVVKARASATQVRLPENATPEQIEAFAKAQNELSGALGKLLMVSEAYPQIQTTGQFASLQKQLRDVESQATAARSLWIKEIQAYNVTVRSFPHNLVAMATGFQRKPQVQFDNPADLKRSPRVDFGTKK